MSDPFLVCGVRCIPDLSRDRQNKLRAAFGRGYTQSQGSGATFAADLPYLNTLSEEPLFVIAETE